MYHPFVFYSPTSLETTPFPFTRDPKTQKLTTIPRVIQAKSSAPAFKTGWNSLRFLESRLLLCMQLETTMMIKYPVTMGKNRVLKIVLTTLKAKESTNFQGQTLFSFIFLGLQRDSFIRYSLLSKVFLMSGTLDYLALDFSRLSIENRRIDATITIRNSKMEITNRVFSKK